MARHYTRACLVVALAACGGKGVTDSTVVVPPTDTSSHGTVQRTSFAVHVAIDPADAAIASAVGISVSGLSVRLSKSGSSDAPLIATTSAAGDVTFTNLLDGLYTASVERTLSTAEQNRLSASDRDATVFAGGVTMAVSPPNTPTASMALVAARRGGLVISELFGYWGTPIPYNWGSYIEIYNNSDSTLYLDGMYLAATPFNILHDDTRASCDEPAYAPYRTDSTTLWVQSGLQFPGTGSQYPVLPGQARVYAADALNHRLASGSDRYPDLSKAQFEQVGNDADTDNPTAANMLRAFSMSTGANGRGLRVVEGAWALMRSTAMSRVREATLNPYKAQTGAGVPFTPQVVYGIPRDEIVDLVGIDDSPDFKAYLATTTLKSTLCQPFLASAFDRAAAEVYDPNYRPGAIRRRSLGKTADGRDILMRTRTSARDLEVTTNLLSRSLGK